MSEVAWYARGEMGEYVLGIVESAIDGSITDEQFADKLTAIGLSAQEVMDVFAEEVLGV